MFKKVLVTILSIGAITLTGCSLFTSDETPTPVPTEVIVDTNPVDYDPLNPTIGSYDAGIPNNAPITEHWLSPATYNITNYWAGFTAKLTIRVHNGNSYPTPFSVLYTQPDNVDAGYSSPVYDIRNWVNISDQYPTIPAYSTQEIIVTLAIPEGTVITAKQWMFWICVKDISQDTMVQTRLCSKVKITME